MNHDTETQILNVYSDYITKLPGIINANVVWNGNEIQEVHVLADQSRTPKQIARDVQSLFMAQFQKEIDHRIISIAQIESELKPIIRLPSRYIIEAVTVSKKRNSTDVEVTLSLDGKSYSGKETNLKDEYDLNRGIVQATLTAIEMAEESKIACNILDVRFCDIAGERMVIVCIYLSSGDKYPGRYSGTAFSNSDDSIAVVKATLDSINRKIGYK